MFCNEEFTGNRSSLLNHMAKERSFSIGLPDNIVYCNEFLHTLQWKLIKSWGRHGRSCSLRTTGSSLRMKIMIGQIGRLIPCVSCMCFVSSKQKQWRKFTHTWRKLMNLTCTN